LTSDREDPALLQFGTELVGCDDHPEPQRVQNESALRPLLMNRLFDVDFQVFGRSFRIRVPLGVLIPKQQNARPGFRPFERLGARIETDAVLTCLANHPVKVVVGFTAERKIGIRSSIDSN